MELPFAFTLLRVGKRGAYAVTPQGVWFCPSVDPAGPTVDATGCGNCSTAVAGLGFPMGCDPAMSLVMGTVAAGYTAMQMGPIPPVTDERMEQAATLCAQLYPQVVKNKVF